jgi:hypothetical protein
MYRSCTRTGMVWFVVYVLFFFNRNLVDTALYTRLTTAKHFQHPSESLCEQCHEGRTVNTIVVDAKPLTLCDTCLKEFDDGKSK